MKTLACLLAPLLLALLLAPSSVRASEVMRNEKYQLPNGLTVILHEDHKLPQVVVNIWYHVGTREEPSGRSGFAHLFEHLMFMGTKRVPNSQFDLIMESGGGWNNASTSYDRTNYYDVAPANMLPTLLWLEADRMETLGAAMTQEKLDLQRDVVRNERREGYDNAPYGPAEIKISELMYPVDHPYHFDVIGSHEDLQAATVKDVTDFFDTYYVPNNATLVVAGDFDSAQVKPLIAGLFSSIPRGAEPPRRSTPVAQFERVERHTMTDEIQLPKVIMTWHSPNFYRPGDAEIDLTAFALGSGKSSRLYRRLVREEELAVGVDVYQMSRRLGSVFRIEAMLKPGASLERVEAVIDDELARFRKEGPTADEIKRGVAELEAATIKRMQSLREVADTLNHYDAYLGEPDSLEWDLARYAAATPAGVRAAAAQWLRPDARLVVRIIPKDKDEGGMGRDQRPADFEPAAFTAPAPYLFRLENGLQVWHLDRPGLPLVSAQLLLPGGGKVNAPEEAGLAALAAEMLLEGAGSMDAAAFADALNLLGATLETSAGQDDSEVALSALTKHADSAFALLRLVLTEPRLSDACFDQQKALSLDGLQQLVDLAPDLGRRAAAEVYFGRSDPRAYALDGYAKTVASLSLDQVRRYHETFHGPAGAVMLMAGDLRNAQAQALVQKHLGSWKQVSQRPPQKAREALSRSGETQVTIVDRPAAAQTVVRFVFPGVAFDAPTRVGLELLNTLFGGSFTSRLNANLREKHGFTYGASSSFATGKQDGIFVAGANVKSDTTGAALREFLAEFARIRAGGITAQEAEKALASEQATAMQAFGTLDGALRAFSPYARYGLPPARLQADLATAADITVADLDALAQTQIARPGGVLVLVGDADLIRAQLKGLPFPDATVVTAAQALAGDLLK